MIVHEIYEDHNIVYTVSPDDAVPAVQREWGLVQFRVLDELTGQPPLTSLTLHTEFPRVTPVTGVGIAGFAGIPIEAFSDLHNSNYPVDYRLEANRYLPQEGIFTVPADLNFPPVFTPQPPMTLNLRRAATAIRGRVYRTGATLTPVAGASVTLTGYWPTLPPTGAPVAPNIVSLQPTAYLDRLATGFLRAFQLNPAAGIDKTLLAQFRPDEDEAQLSDRIGINLGDVLALDLADPDRTEYLPIVGINGSSTPAQPARVRFAYPPRLVHTERAILTPVTFGAVGPANNLISTVMPGDTCPLLNGVAGMAGGITVEVGGGGAPSEFHTVSLFAAVSNAAGFYRLPPVQRTAQLRFDVNDTVNPILTTNYQPEYGSGDNVVDFRIPI